MSDHVHLLFLSVFRWIELKNWQAAIGGFGEPHTIFTFPLCYLVSPDKNMKNKMNTNKRECDFRRYACFLAGEKTEEKSQAPKAWTQRPLQISFALSYEDSCQLISFIVTMYHQSSLRPFTSYKQTQSYYIYRQHTHVYPHLKTSRFSHHHW